MGTPNSLPLDSDGVVGYYTILELPDLSYWDRAQLHRLDSASYVPTDMDLEKPTPEQIQMFLKAANANPYEDHPDAKHQVIQRSNYLKFLFQDKDLGGWGNFKSDEPDSYIFRGDVIKQSGLKPLHTYRVIVPSLIGTTKKAAPEFNGPPNPVEKVTWYKVASFSRCFSHLLHSIRTFSRAQHQAGVKG